MFLLALYITSFFILFPFNLTIHKTQEKIINPIEEKVLAGEIVFYQETPTITPTPFPTVVPTATPTIGPTATPVITQAPVQTQSNTESWGEAKQINDNTYTIKVKNDSQMAKAEEVLTALNNYRTTHGVGTLSWNTNLANLAQSRADQFNREQKLDGHAGFNQLFSDPNNMKTYGFMRMGENSSFGFTLDGIHLIEWVYAADAPHNNNQLDPNWTDVGIGVNGTASDLVFGGNKI